MRTLSEITAAIRMGHEFTKEEAAYAVVAYDVLTAALRVEENPLQLVEYFKAAETSPAEYIGRLNDPAEHDAREWYRTMHSAGVT